LRTISNANDRCWNERMGCSALRVSAILTASASNPAQSAGVIGIAQLLAPRSTGPGKPVDRNDELLDSYFNLPAGSS
jgi:hypothetical protein